MINIISGETIDIKSKEFKDPKQVFKILKGGCRIIQHNWHGNKSEAVIEICFEGEMSDNKEVNRLVKNFWEKTQRRLPEIIYVKILLYEERNYPKYHIWVKRVDGEPLEIQQEEMEKLWGENGTVRVIELTPNKVEAISQYFLRHRTNMEVYPPHIQILGMTKSKKLKRVVPKEMTYKEAEQKAKGYVPIYQATKSQVQNINGIEQEIQRYTFQELRKKTKNIKLSRSTKAKKYKGKKITKEQFSAGADTEETQEEIKTTPRKKPFGEIEKELQEVFKQIGQEVQEKINKNKGGNCNEQ